MKKILFFISLLAPGLSYSAFRTDFLTVTGSATVNGPIRATTATVNHVISSSGSFSYISVSTMGSVRQIRWSDGTIQVSSPPASSGGGGGGNPIEVFSNFDNTRSSPTSSISIGDALKLSVTGSTAVITVDFSSVTSRNDAILNQNTLQTGATFYVSSGTVNGSFYTRSVDPVYSLPSPGTVVLDPNLVQLQMYAGGDSNFLIGLEGDSEIIMDLIQNGGIVNSIRMNHGGENEYSSNGSVIGPGGEVNSRHVFYTNNDAKAIIDWDGRVAMGDAATWGASHPNAALDVRHSTAEIRLGPTTTNYMSLVVSSSGTTTFDAISNSNGGAFVFKDTTTFQAPILVRSIQFPDGTIQVSSPVTVVPVSISTLTAGATNFIFNQNVLQTGATYYVSSGTVHNYLAVGLPGSRPALVFDSSVAGSNPILNMYNGLTSPGWTLRFSNSNGTQEANLSAGSAGWGLSLSSASGSTPLSRFTINKSGSYDFQGAQAQQFIQISTGGAFTMYLGPLTLNATNQVRWADGDSSNYVAFKASNTVASNVTWVLPAADGSNNQALVTNGAGNLSFATISGAGDNLGNHIATRTISAGFGISATTATFSSSMTLSGSRLVQDIAPSDGQVLKWSSSNSRWEPNTDSTGSGGGGGASSFTYTFNPDQAKLPGANPCVITNSTQAVTSSLLCDDSTDESVTWSTTLTNYNGADLWADIYFTMVSTNSGQVRTDVSLMCVSDDDSADVDTESFDTVNSTSTTVAATIGHMQVARTILCDMDECAQGDLMVVKYNRDANHSEDTAPGDIEVRKVRIYEGSTDLCIAP